MSRVPSSPRVVVQIAQGRVLIEKVDTIISNRMKDREEQYLVRWISDKNDKFPPMSWHRIRGLDRCLEKVQDYLTIRESQPLAVLEPEVPVRKRKSPDWIDSDRRPSPIDRRLNDGSRAPSLSRSPSVSSNTNSGNANSGAQMSPDSIDVYNGVLASQSGFLFVKHESGPDIARISIKDANKTFLEAARQASVDKAAYKIRAEYMRRLRVVPGRPIHLVNTEDNTTPSLRFRFIAEYVMREGTRQLEIATQIGCSCKENMGRSIGCEYTKKCECLEYAAVDESRLDNEQRQLYKLIKEGGGSTMGLPKKFPYYTGDTTVRRTGSLVPFYLHSRRPIYECNDKCGCGIACRNKNVQFGRTVEIEIFKTGAGRGWGLRCRSNLFEGQFIDTYRGEVITDAEATRREEASSSKASKASYLYSLDKFAESEGIEEKDIFVVDGESMGGPTKFLNHSCDPNCRQYTVSYNKNDCRVYDIAFFACRDIPAGEELTFDYLDKDEDDDDDTEAPGPDSVPCLCGSVKCRKWLWT